MSLKQFLFILRARWRVSLYVFLGVMLVAGLVMLFPNQYTATTEVLIDAKSADPINGGAVPAQFLPGYMATQLDVINSPRIARRVVTQLGIPKSPEARRQWLDDTEGKGTIEDYYANLLQKKLEVLPTRDSNVVTINFTNRDAGFATQVANTFAQVYIDTNLELKVEPARQYAQWFDARTLQLRKTLEAAQAKFSAYQRDKGIFIPTQGQLDIENTRLGELSSQLVAVQAQHSESASRQRMASNDMASSPDVINNQVIANLRAAVARAEANLMQVSAQYGKNHPEYLKSQSELDSLRNKLDAEMRQVSSSIGTADAVNRQRETVLRASLEVQKKRVLELTQTKDELSVLQREMENAQRSFDLVSQRLAQTNLESQTQQTNVVVLTTATVPALPSFPRPLLVIAIALALGLILAPAGAFVAELMDQRVRSPEDLAMLVEWPVLASIPWAGKPARRRLFGRSRKQKLLGPIAAH